MYRASIYIAFLVGHEADTHKGLKCKIVRVKQMRYEKKSAQNIHTFFKCTAIKSHTFEVQCKKILRSVKAPNL